MLSAEIPGLKPGDECSAALRDEALTIYSNIVKETLAESKNVPWAEALEICYRGGLYAQTYFSQEKR